MAKDKIKYLDEQGELKMLSKIEELKKEGSITEAEKREKPTRTYAKLDSL